jgi:hypothetical protein
MLPARKVTPHVVQNTEGRGESKIDNRRMRHLGYSFIQRIQKRVEEIFSWVKVVGGFRKTQFKGVQRTQFST